MRVTGTLVYRRNEAQTYFLMINYMLCKTVYFLISPIHRESRINFESGLAVNRSHIHMLNDYLNIEPNQDYVMEIVQHIHVNGEMYSLNKSPILTELIIILLKCKNFRFYGQQIGRNNHQYLNGIDQIVFSASNRSISLSYTMQNGIYSFLRYKGPEMEVDFSNSKKYKFPNLSNYYLKRFFIKNQILPSDCNILDFKRGG